MIKTVLGDITKIDYVDVIVNAANGKAIQVILEKGDYKIKHKIIEDISKE